MPAFPQDGRHERSGDRQAGDGDPASATSWRAPRSGAARRGTWLSNPLSEVSTSITARIWSSPAPTGRPTRAISPRGAAHEPCQNHAFLHEKAQRGRGGRIGLKLDKVGHSAVGGGFSPEHVFVMQLPHWPKLYAALDVAREHER